MHPARRDSAGRRRYRRASAAGRLLALALNGGLFLALFLCVACQSPAKNEHPAPKSQPTSKSAVTKPAPKNNSWVKAKGTPPVDLLGISFLSEQEASVVGDIGPGNGPILHTQDAGATWIVGTTTAEILTDVSFDEKKGVAVGYAGHIAVSIDAARSWTVATRDEQTILRGASRRGDNIVAVGDNAIFVSTDGGTSFNSMPLTEPLELQDVVMWSDTEGAAAASDGTILLTKDLWKTYTAKDVSSDLFASIARYQKNICAAGGSTIVCVDDSLSSISVSNNSSVELFDIVFDGARGFAVGAKGTILSTKDGKSWTKETSGTNADLFAVAIRAKRVIAVGAKGTIVSLSL